MTKRPEIPRRSAAMVVRFLLEQTGWTPYRLAKEAGVHSKTVYRALDENAGHTTSFSTLMALAEAAGEELPLSPGALESAVGLARVREIPLADAIDALEPGNVGRKLELAKFSDHVVVESNSTSLVAFRLDGTGVDRLAPDGATLVVDYRKTRLEDGAFFVIRTGEGNMVRRYRTSPARFEPYSSDPNAAETLFGGKEIEVLGRVVHVMYDL